MNGFDLAGRQVMETTTKREGGRDLCIDLFFCFQLKVGLVTERAAAANYGNLDDEGKDTNTIYALELSTHHVIQILQGYLSTLWLVLN